MVAVDDLSRGHRESVPANCLRVLRLHDTVPLAEVLRGIDAVIHFAAYIAVGESAREPEFYYANNLSGTISLFEAMNRAGVRRLVFSSTAAVYGEPSQSPIPESAPIQPVNPYGDGKAAVEAILRQLDRFRGLRYVALRYFNACGAEPKAGLGEAHDPETHLIPLLLQAAVTGKPIQIFGDDYPTPDGTCVRDYIHVADLAGAHLTALDHLMNGGDSRVYNAGTGSGYTVMEVLRAVEQVTGLKVPYHVAPRRDGDAASLVADSSRLQTELGWKPQRSGLTSIVEDAWSYFQSARA